MIRWRQRNIRQIMIRRSQGVQSEKQKKCLEEETNEDANHQISIRSGEIEVEQIIKIIQQKARVNFYQGYDKKKFQRINVEKPTVVEQCFNHLACSYFVISGSVFLIDSSQFEKEEFDFNKDDIGVSQKIMLIQVGQGIGWLFGKDKSEYTFIFSRKAVLFRVQHSSFDMKRIQRDCLMTTHQKIDVLKRFKIFSLIDNVHKILTPFVKPNKLLKGQSIYREGQKSTDFYILIQGEVSFSSTVKSIQNPQKLSPLSKYSSKKSNKNSIITYSISKNSFFGQQQVLQGLQRQQTAICSSIECLILMIPGSKLSFLLSVPQIKKILIESAAMKEQARSLHIKSYLNLPFKAKCQTQQAVSQSNQGFQHLKSTIFFNLFKPSEKSIIKSKYSRDQIKVYHNHSVPVELPPSPIKEPQNPFSMLAVNKQVYEKTLMRFRYSLKEIKGQNKFIQPPHRGRSLQSICKTLKLTQSFFCFDHQQQGQTQQGIAFYNTDKKLKRHIRITKSLKPKNINCNNKLKSEYIDYLQLAI